MNFAQMTGEVTTVAALAWTWAAEFVPRLGGALLILAAAFAVAGWVGRALSTALSRTERIDPTLRPVLLAIARYAILIVAFVAMLGQLGVQTASVLAALGAAGLAIGLAIQGTLANIAAGLMLLWLRPFRVGEHIETPAVSGRVIEIGLFATRLDTPEGVYRFVPNSELWPKPISNFTRNRSRMIQITLALGHQVDFAAVRRIILDIAGAEERLAQQPPPEVYVDGLTEKGSNVTFRAWADTGSFLATQRRLAERIKTAVEAAGVRFPV